MIRLGSVLRYSTESVGGKNLLEQNVDISCYSADMAVMYLEMEILRKYLYDTYPEELLDVDTIKDYPHKKYYVGKSSVFKSDDAKVSKKCSDILALLEFSMNRFTPAKDNCMKSYLRTPCYSLAKVTGYKNVWDKENCTGNPLLFSINGLPSCTVTFDFGKRSLGTSRSPSRDREPEKDHADSRMMTWRDVRLKNQGDNEHIGFEDLFKALSGGDMDMYVYLDGEDSDLKNLSDSYWTSKGDGSIRPSRPCVPLRTLVSHLVGLFDDVSGVRGEDVRHHMMHLIDCDIRDVLLDIIDPREAFLGEVGCRDDDFETSESILSRIIGAARGYVERYILMARILHCVLMSSILIGDSKIYLSFSYDSLLKLMDPVLFDWNYPPELIFTSGARDVFERYSKYLSDMNYVLVPRAVVNGDAKDTVTTIKRRNSEKMTLPAKWEKAKGNGDLVWQHHDMPTYTEMCLLGRNSIDKKRYCEKPFIVLATPRDVYDAEKAVYEMGNGMRKMRYMAVLGDREYVSVRPDFHDIIEIGIGSDPASVYRLHRNGVDSRRKVATAPVLEDLCAAYGIGPYGTLAEGLEKLESGVEPTDLWSRMAKSFASLSRVQIAWDDRHL